MANAQGDAARHQELERWLDASRHGSPEAMGQLLEAYRPYLLQIAEAELVPALRAKIAPSDLVQQTFINACGNIERFVGGEEDFRAWLRRILLNQLQNARRDYLQTEKRQVGRELPIDRTPFQDVREGLVAAGPSPSAAAQANEQDIQLREQLARLPDHYRQVIQWRNYDRLAFEEIAGRLGQSADAARKLWHRALLALQTQMDQPDESDS